MDHLDPTPRSPSAPVHARRRTPVLAAALLVVQLAAYAPSSHPAAGVWATRQGTVAGRYVLRSVNGLPLPATLPGEDPQHSIQVSNGFLQLNPDGTYLCRTIATAVELGMEEPFSDTLIGSYSVVTPGTIELTHKGQRPDTVAASGFQIMWSHPLRLAQGQFLYSK